MLMYVVANFVTVMSLNRHRDVTDERMSCGWGLVGEEVILPSRYSSTSFEGVRVYCYCN